MIQGFYSAATALDTAAQNHDVVAHNLAHAAVPGYRRRGLAFETFDQTLSGATGSSGAKLFGTQPSVSYNEFSPGDVQYTGNPLDVAIKGDSFFVLQGPRGPLYTRNGTFDIDGQGRLLSKSGLPVSGEGGTITIPPQASQVSIGEDGTVRADNAAVGKLQLARFTNPAALTPAGTTLFEAPASAGQQTGSGTVRQGYREGSNVQVVSEMVSLITGMRQYEAAQRALRSLSDAIGLSTQSTAGG